MITILDCPFCGHTDVEICECSTGEYAVDCPECCCIGPICETIMIAVYEWNKAPRSAPASSEATS